MAIRYIGNCDWHQVGSVEWTVGGYGEDRCRARFIGRVDKERAFEDLLRKWLAASTYTSMFLEGWSSNSSKPYLPEVEATFVGFRNGQLPPVKVVNGLSTQSAQGEGTFTQGEDTLTASGSFTYRASRSTYTWFETSVPPKFPRYYTVQLPVNPFTQITHQSITVSGGTGDTPPSNLIPLAAFVKVFNSLIPAFIISDYSREPLAEGRLWACSATVDYVLQNG